MNTIEQIKTALGEPLKRKLGEQEFEFYPLDVSAMPDFFDLASKTQGKDEIELLKRENAEILVSLILKMLKNSFPKDTPEELLGQFAMKHFTELQEILVELHSPDVDKMSPQQKSRIEQLRAKVLAQKNVPSPTDSGTNQATS